MDVRIEPQVRVEALDERDCAWAPAGHGSSSSQRQEHEPDERAVHGREELGVGGEQASQREGEGDRPQPQRRVWQNSITQVRHHRLHAPGRARGTRDARATGIRDDPLVAAAHAFQP